MIRFLAVTIGFAMSVGVSAAHAQTSGGAPAVEAWAAISGSPDTLDGTVTTAFAPPLLLDGSFTSRGGQTLTVGAGRTAGFSGGVNVFPWRNVGVQVQADWRKSDVAGANGSYATSLQYVSRPPPNNEPVPVAISQSTPWPDTSGSIALLVVSANLAARIGRSGGTNVTVSGGPAYYRLTGTLRPIGYTTFRLGGHSVLFEDDYELEARVEPAHHFGVNAGAELMVPVGPRVAFVAGYRYLAASDVELTLTPRAVLNADRIAFQQSLEEVAKQLGPVRSRMSVAGSRVIAGVNVRLR